MDVGLNNRNTLGEINPALADVAFLVEANSNEQFTLWQEWAKESMSNIAPLKPMDLDLLRITLRNYPSLLAEVTRLNKNVKQNEHPRIDWEQISAGFLITIARVKHGRRKLPVCIQFSFAIINGKKICFYDNCSMAGDSEMVEKWLIKRFQLTHDKYTRWNHTDARNFHNCVHSLDKRLDIKPRNTKYKGAK